MQVLQFKREEKEPPKPKPKQNTVKITDLFIRNLKSNSCQDFWYAIHTLSGVPE